jgi:hypothetical protein
MAERVVDKDRANFCEYFNPGQVKGGVGAQQGKSAQAKLEELFKKKK